MEKYYRLSQDLCRASGFVSKTTAGQIVKLSSSAKIIYAYMYHRYEYFVTKLKGEYFETQATIGDGCDVESKTVGRILSMFMDHGIINATLSKPKSGGYMRYTYQGITDDIEFVFGKIKKDKPQIVVDNSVATEYSDDFLSGIDFTGD